MLPSCDVYLCELARKWSGDTGRLPISRHGYGFRITNRLDDEFTVVLEMRNITDHACILDRGSYGANGSPTAPDRTEPRGEVFVLDPDSNNRVWGTGSAEQLAAVLKPGKFAYFTISWKTKPTQHNGHCIQPLAVNWPVHIVAPSLLKPLCSEIVVSSFALGAPSDSAGLEGGAGKDSNIQILALTSKRSTDSEAGELLLHVSLATADAAMFVSKDAHPTVYLRRRSSDGATEFRATLPLPQSGCQPGDPHVGIVVPKVEGIDWRMGFDLDPDFCGSVIRPEHARADYSLQVFKAIASSGAGVRFIDSNVLHIEFEHVTPKSPLGIVHP